MTSSNQENPKTEKKSIDIYKEITEKNTKIDKKIVKKILSSFCEIVGSKIDSETAIKGKLFNLRISIKNKKAIIIATEPKK